MRAYAFACVRACVRVCVCVRERQRERERENTAILFNKAIAPFEGVSTIYPVMQCTHSIQFADVGMLQIKNLQKNVNRAAVNSI